MKKTYTLATLTGSEKQIAWAEDIRQKVIDQVEDVLAKERQWTAEGKMHSNQKIRDKAEASRVLIEDMLEEMLKIQTSASWYINRRSGDLSTNYGLLGSWEEKEYSRQENTTLARDSSFGKCHLYPEFLTDFAEK